MFNVRHDHWIRKICRKLTEKRTVDLMFLADISRMEKTLEGKAYFNYIAMDGKCYRARFRWWRTRHYLNFKMISPHLGEYPLKEGRSHTFVSIYMVDEYMLGLKKSYSNPASRLSKKRR